ncbi:HlyD family efflux transporter periplasmic adaptor subunit [Brevundimonas sp. NPDC090276]|uniref:HlyD family secretion protein n=1 Tax=Brevundimonas sp. NPDC090276 TaxID=3363956 RepID=UPI00383BD292
MTEQNETEIAADPKADARRGVARKKAFLALGVAIVAIGGGSMAYGAVFGGKTVTTDNAYVGADVAQVTPLVGGPVREVRVADAQAVRKGEVLVVLDDSDARLALVRAEAGLAAAERRVRGLVATDAGLGAQVAARAADQASASARLTAARSGLDKARIDLQRREALAASGSVSGEELTQARDAVVAARSEVQAAEAAQALASANRNAAVSSRQASTAMIDGTTIDTHPDVLAARAARDQARLDLERTVIRAPLDGVISRRQVQVGQRVQPGLPLMMVVPIQAAYVDANFKEVQLAQVRPGQPVTLKADLYGGKVEYTGRVVGFSGGTGAAFAVVPAQNATGNWIKVVQRLPVRIALDPKQLQEHPLRVGLSMDVAIDVSK